MSSSAYTVRGILLLLLIGVSANGVNSECLQCKYDGTDKNTCRDYGWVNNDFVPWYLGSEECLDYWGIKKDAPDADSICSSSSAFVNDLRFGFLSNKGARLGLGTSEGGFFEEDPNQNNKVVLKDSITINGESYDCVKSQSDCYNAMKPYFESDPEGQKEMKQVCDTLYAEVRNAAQLEQSLLRGRLCMEYRDGEAIPSSCEPLWGQLRQMMEDNPSNSCNSYQIGIGTRTPPGCEPGGGSPGGNDKGGGSPGGDNKSGTAAIMNSRDISVVSTIFTISGFVLTLLYL